MGTFSRAEKALSVRLAVYVVHLRYSGLELNDEVLILQPLIHRKILLLESRPIY